MNRQRTEKRYKWQLKCVGEPHPAGQTCNGIFAGDDTTAHDSSPGSCHAQHGTSPKVKYCTVERLQYLDGRPPVNAVAEYLCELYIKRISTKTTVPLRWCTGIGCHPPVPPSHWSVKPPVLCALSLWMSNMQRPMSNFLSTQQSHKEC